MEEILKLAKELGIMLRSTDLYCNLMSISKELNSDKGSKDLFEEYVSFAENIRQREIDGDIIEAYEKERLNDLSSLVRNNELIVRYIEAKNRYIELLEKIQNEVSADENGDFYA